MEMETVKTVIDTIVASRPNERKQYSEAVQKMLDAVRLTPRYKLALRLYASGVKPDEICNSLKITPDRFRVIRWSTAGRAYTNALIAEYEYQFKLMFGKVVTYIDTALDSPDFKVKKDAASLWAGMSGKLMQTVKVERTAEDNVIDILKGKVINPEGDYGTTSLQTGDRDTVQDSEQSGEDS